MSAVSECVPPGVQWIQNALPPDGWCGMVYGRYRDTDDKLGIFCAGRYSIHRGWWFALTRDKGTSGGFSVRETQTEDKLLDVRAWLAVGNEITL